MELSSLQLAFFEQVAASLEPSELEKPFVERQPFTGPALLQQVVKLVASLVEASPPSTA